MAIAVGFQSIKGYRSMNHAVYTPAHLKCGTAAFKWKRRSISTNVPSLENFKFWSSKKHLS